MPAVKNKYIIGIDEVGRGPLAGPVTVGVVMCDTKTYAKLKRNENLPMLGKDSKKLSAKLREQYAEAIKKTTVRYEVIHISSVVIDTIGIAGAIRKAIATGMKKLTKGHDLNNISVLLDGGLRLGAEYKHQKTIIKGDEKKKIIAWASILAKVSRDAVMARLSKRYLEYGFGVHKGYGTLAHRNKIKECGLSPIHRRSFCRKFLST